MKNAITAFIALAFLLIVGTAHARDDIPRVFTLTLDTTGAVSSVSAFSGTSPMLVDDWGSCVIVNSQTGAISNDDCDGGVEDTIISAYGLGPWYVFQIDSISQYGTPSTGLADSDFDVYLEHSLDPDDWADATRIYVWKDQVLSGATKQARTIKVKPVGYYRPKFVTGTTSFASVTIRGAGGMNGEFEESPYIPLSHATDDFGTSGLTPFTTSFTVPDGCNCVEVQFTTTAGGYSSPATSGVSKILEKNKVRQMPITEFTGGSYGPGAATAGEINAQFWTECPPK